MRPRGPLSDRRLQQLLLQNVAVTKQSLSEENREYLQRQLRQIQEEEDPNLINMQANPLKDKTQQPHRVLYKRKRAGMEGALQTYKHISVRNLLQVQEELAKSRVQTQNAPVRNIGNVQKLMLNTPSEQKRWNNQPKQRAEERQNCTADKQFNHVEYVDQKNIFRYNSDDEFLLFSVLVGIRNNNFILEMMRAKCAQLDVNIDQVDSYITRLMGQVSQSVADLHSTLRIRAEIQQRTDLQI